MTHESTSGADAPGSGAHNQPGSGAYSILGYEYQIDVSVWLALDLVLESKLAQELILEPASQEDLEADLTDAEPARVTSDLPLASYRMIVQVKLRSGDAWTMPGIQSLLQHGTVRKSAFQRLEEDPRARYLLVTNAALNGRTRDLGVRRPGNWPKAEKTADLKGLPPDYAGRIAIIGNQDEERLGLDIEQKLLESFRIPRPNLRDCRLALREEARARIVGAGAGRWIREELEQLIKSHGGYIASSPELRHYVHPTNWPELIGAMSTQYAVFIVGQSGTGKTISTHKLYEELRTTNPGLTRVPITLGPEQLENDNTLPPVLYDIVDPWGKYNFDPRRRPWNSQLSQAFSRASHDRMIVATSRRDVAQAAGALNTVQSWVINLEAEHYGKSERISLYRSLIDDLPWALQGVATSNLSKVLEQLGTPLEIQKFFDALPTIDIDHRHNPKALINEAVRKAHHESIERTVIDQIEEREDLVAATVIWALLKLNDKISIDLLRQLEEEFFDLDPRYEKGFQPLLNFFVAARNLRQIDSTVSYFHPRVESGIEQALGRDRLGVQRTLRLLIDRLVLLDGASEHWGVRSAAHLLFAADRTPDIKPRISNESRAAIDNWLVEALSEGGKDFGSFLAVAASAGSPRSDVAEVARFLLHRPDQRFGYMDMWFLPVRDEQWYARMRASPIAKVVLEKFIQCVLPNSQDYYTDDFVPAVERMASGLTPAFLLAAEDAVHNGVMRTNEVIAAGALKDVEGFERIIDIAVRITTPTEDELAGYAKINLAIINGEYSEEYAQYLSESEDGWTASQFIDSYVVHVRSEFGWERIAAHKHRSFMLFAWLRAMMNAQSVSEAEVAGAFDAAYNTKEEDSVWHILESKWNAIYEPKLFERVTDGHRSTFVRLSALSCIVKHAPESLMKAVQGLFQHGRYIRLVELAVDLGGSHPTSSISPIVEEGHLEVLGMLANAPAVFREIYGAAASLVNASMPEMSVETIEFLINISDACESVRLFRLKLDEHLPAFVPEDVRWLLSNADERDDAVIAVKAAIRHQMNEDIELALSHRFSKVASLALRAFASPMEAPLPSSVLDMVQVKGNPVRSALVELLDKKPHRNHLETLLRLARDKWSTSYAQHGQAENYPVARAAVVGISKLGNIEDAAAEQLYQLAVDTADMTLRFDIFSLLASAAKPDYQLKLFELATSPGQSHVRRLAAHALLAAHEKVTSEILEKVTPQFLTMSDPDIASRLLVLLCLAGPGEMILAAASALATHLKRRVLLLLAIRFAGGRFPLVVEQIVGMLPQGHPAVDWAAGGTPASVSEQLLDGLGDVINVGQVMDLMNQSSPQ